MDSGYRITHIEIAGGVQIKFSSCSKGKLSCSNSKHDYENIMLYNCLPSIKFGVEERASDPISRIDCIVDNLFLIIGSFRALHKDLVGQWSQWLRGPRHPLHRHEVSAQPHLRSLQSRSSCCYLLETQWKGNIFIFIPHLVCWFLMKYFPWLPWIPGSTFINILNHELCSCNIYIIYLQYLLPPCNIYFLLMTVTGPGGASLCWEYWDSGWETRVPNTQLFVIAPDTGWSVWNIWVQSQQHSLRSCDSPHCSRWVI